MRRNSSRSTAYDLDLQRHHHRSIRLKGHDYAQTGAYFITICAQDRVCLFGEVVDGEMRLNEAGKIVHATWEGLPNHYANVVLDSFVVMPNHLHGIVMLHDPNVGVGFKPAPTETAPTICKSPDNATPLPKRYGLPEIVRGFKTFSARGINTLRGTPGTTVWQRKYYEHIIRTDDALNRIRQYIADNPLRWTFDRENPTAINPEPEDAWRI